MNETKTLFTAMTIVGISQVLTMARLGASVLPGGVVKDDQASIAYVAATGEVAVDVAANKLFTSVNIDSLAGIFTELKAENLGGSFDNDADQNIFKATFGGNFGSLSFGNVAQTGLDEAFLLSDLTVVGSYNDGPLGPVDLIYHTDGAIGTGNAFNGSFNNQSDVNRLELNFGEIPLAEPSMEMSFQLSNLGGLANGPSNPMDLIRTESSGNSDRFVSDLDLFSNLAVGDTRSFAVTLDTFRTGRFRSVMDLHLTNALDASESETLRLQLTGRVIDPPAGQVLPEGAGDEPLPLISYDPATGELLLSSTFDLTAINISSATGIFTGPTPSDVLDGSFDVHNSQNVFKAVFGGSFGSLSFGPVVQTGLTTDFLLRDLSITGSRAGGGSLDNVFFSRIVAVPEPASMLLLLMGLLTIMRNHRSSPRE